MSVPQRIAITGASGLIGTALVGHLKSEGHTVQRLVRRAPVAGFTIVTVCPFFTIPSYTRPIPNRPKVIIGEIE